MARRFQLCYLALGICYHPTSTKLCSCNATWKILLRGVQGWRFQSPSRLWGSRVPPAFADREVQGASSHVQKSHLKSENASTEDQNCDVTVSAPTFLSGWPSPQIFVHLVQVDLFGTLFQASTAPYFTASPWLPPAIHAIAKNSLGLYWGAISPSFDNTRTSVPKRKLQRRQRNS